MTTHSGEIDTCLRERPFRPHPWLRNAHMQTIVASRLPRRFPWERDPFREVEVRLADRTCLRVRVSESGSDTALLVLHGMTGSWESGYMNGFAFKAAQEGWTSFLPNLYNTNSDVDRPRIFHAGASQPAREAILDLVERCRVRRLGLIGVSMGANILLKMLGEWGDEAPSCLECAAAISPLCDLSSSWSLMEQPRNRLYQIYFTRRLRQLVSDRSQLLKDHLDLEAALKVRSIREFDEHVTAPLAGFQDAFHYYREVSSSRLLHGIRVPTLILHAKDDPFLPWQPLDSPQAHDNPALSVHFSPTGGHLGFLEEDSLGDVDRCWAENRVMDYMRLALSD